MMTGCTTLFRKKWVEVYNEEPSIDELNNLLGDGAIRIQPYMVFWDNKKNDFIKILAAYWMPHKNIVCKLDWESKSFVTVFFPEDIKTQK